MDVGRNGDVLGDGGQFERRTIDDDAALVVGQLRCFCARVVFHADGGAVDVGHVLVLQQDGVVRAVQHNLERFRLGAAATVGDAIVLHHVHRGTDLACVNDAVSAADGVEVVPEAVDGVVWRARRGDSAVAAVGVARAKADEAVGGHVHLVVAVAIEVKREAQVYLRVGVCAYGHHVGVVGRGDFRPGQRRAALDVGGNGDVLGDGSQFERRAINDDAALVVGQLRCFRPRVILHADGGAVDIGHILVLQCDGVIGAVEDDLERLRLAVVAAVDDAIVLHHVDRGTDLARVDRAIGSPNGIEIIPEAVNRIVWRARVGDSAVAAVGVARAKADEAVRGHVHLVVGVAIEFEGEAQVHRCGVVVPHGHYVCAIGRGDVCPTDGYAGEQVRGDGDGLGDGHQFVGRAIRDHGGEHQRGRCAAAAAKAAVRQLRGDGSAGVFHADGGVLGQGKLEILQGDGVVGAIEDDLEGLRLSQATAVRRLLPLDDGVRGVYLLRVDVAVVAADGVEVGPQTVDGIVRLVGGGDGFVVILVVAVAEADVAIGADVEVGVGVAVKLEGETDVEQGVGVVSFGDDGPGGGDVLPVHGNVGAVVVELLHKLGHGLEL